MGIFEWRNAVGSSISEMGQKTSGSGERSARQGLRYQDRASATLAYQAILEGTLSFIALADDRAGMFDDLVLGIAGQVIGHQYKSSTKPKPVGVRGLLLGKENVIADCAASFKELEAAYPGKHIRVRYVTSHIASVSDKGRFGVKGRDSQDFFLEKDRYPDWSLADWRASVWQPIIDELVSGSGLDEHDFERFFHRFEIELGAPRTIELNHTLDASVREQIVELARAIGDLVGRDDGRTSWTRRELLDELGWPDRFRQRFEHRFPLGAHVQSNEQSEAELEAALKNHSSGYICLLGSPGTGKSTLLERFVQPGSNRKVVRYLAYVPGTAQGQGRGNDANFLADLNSQLISSGFQASRVKDDTLEQRRETFQRLLLQAGKEFETIGQSTIIVIDGLDHVPREEKPVASFLRALPLPASIPEGVVFVLGSQRIDLEDIPREVREQASLPGRKIEIAPLTEAAVSEMVTSIGLASEINSAEVFSVSLGHPLVTQYLLGKLLVADAEERRVLLDGGFEFDGDLEKVYQAAWREAEGADREVAKVLVTLSFVEGRIEPELLAACLSSSAVDNSFKLAHHLIDHYNRGWLIFHNSFRLFLRQKTITLYGAPDPDFTVIAIYRRLAKVAKSAPATSAQRWLEFRYRYLANDHAEAAAIASRRYFVTQFIDGRRSYEVSNDIEDAFACLDAGETPVQLFDLMLAKDEVWRRQQALEMAEQLVAAQIAAGDLYSAEAQLDANHVVGDEWLVVKALLEDGQPERARAIFDRENPWDWYDNHHSGGEDSANKWADFAVVLLDDEQIERRIKMPDIKGDDDKQSFYGQTRQQYLDELRFALARAMLRHDPNCSVDDVVPRFIIKAGAHPILYAESAGAKVRASRHEEALACLGDYEKCQGIEDVHGSWHLHAANLAIACRHRELATRLFANAKIPDLCNLEHRSEEVADAVRYLIRYCVVAAQLGASPPQPALPKEHLFKAIQNHAVRLGTLIGKLRQDAADATTGLSAQIKSSLEFIAGAVADRRDDVLLDYHVRKADQPLFDAICEIVRLSPDAAPDFASNFEACLKLSVCTFRGSLPIVRKFTETIFNFDGDAAAAVARLESSRREVDGARSPQEAIDGLAELAIAFGKIGLQERARELLYEMRKMSLGSYAAAKKDGQYLLWADLLELANRMDPAQAAERSFMMLRLVAGVDDSDAHDQAWRISKTVLVEAIASGQEEAWDALEWAKATGVWRWDALVDAVARGIMRRRPDLLVPIVITWTALCLPYYDEVYNSVTRTGEYLRELVSATPEAQLPEVERIIVAGIERDARSELRPRLLRAFRDALADCGPISPLVSAAVDRWNAEPAFDTGYSSDEKVLPDYFQLQSFEDVEQAVVLDRQRREAQTSVYYGDFVNGTLGKRIGRIIHERPWPEVHAFALRNPELVRDRPIKEALARAAIAAGEVDYAETLLLPERPERDGWGGWASRDTLVYHKARHVLGFADAHKRALDDFVRDLSEGGYGTGSALSSIDEIYPVLYNDIDWPALWDRLAEQVDGYRDYQKVEPVPRNDDVAHDDIDLLTRLFLEAVTFGVSDPCEQATNGLLELVRAGAPELFCRTCSRLLEGEGHAVQLGARLLFEARDNQAVATKFRHELGKLTAHEDACVAAIGEILAGIWGVDAHMKAADLPPLYSLELPPLDETSGRSLRDEESLGPVIDDPAAWTEGFNQWLEALSRYSEVPVSTLRRRVAQLINQWGGVEKYGAKATKQLENSLSPLGLLLPFVRPHIAACLRALHVVVGELWRASRLSESEVDILLHRLTGAPVLPPLVPQLSRPIDIDWPAFPEDTWSTDGNEWIEAEDLRRHCVSPAVVGEWARLVMYRSNSLYTEEMLVTRGIEDGVLENLDRAVGRLPTAFWAAGGIMVDSEREGEAAGIVSLRTSLVGNRSDVLIFDPLLAHALGWQLSEEDPFTFINPDGKTMATTRFWRDGWQQEMKHARAFRWAEGQRVELTEAGRVQVEREGCLPPPVTSRWRTLKPHSSKPELASQWRSDGSKL